MATHSQCVVCVSARVLNLPGIKKNKKKGWELPETSGIGSKRLEKS